MCRYTDLHDTSLYVVSFDNSLADNEAVSTGKKPHTWYDPFRRHVNPALVPQDARYEADRDRMLRPGPAGAGPPYGIALVKGVRERERGETDEAA